MRRLFRLARRYWHRYFVRRVALGVLSIPTMTITDAETAYSASLVQEGRIVGAVGLLPDSEEGVVVGC